MFLPNNKQIQESCRPGEGVLGAASGGGSESDLPLDNMGVVEPAGVGGCPAGMAPAAPAVDDLKYQTPAAATAPADAATTGEMMTVKLRYKQPQGDTSQLIEVPVPDQEKTLAASSESFRFATAVTAFGLRLRNTSDVAQLEWPAIRDLAQSAQRNDAQFRLRAAM